MKQTRKMTALGLLMFCMVLVLSPVTAYATGDAPGLSDVINGQQETVEQPVTTEPVAPVNTQPITDTPTTNTAPIQNTQSEPYSGGLVDTGGLSSEDISDYAGITQSQEAKNTVQSTLGQIMGWVVPILVGVIFAALTFRILIDILYIVAPFLRTKLAPGVQGDQMAENQMGGGMQQGMGGMGMQGGMMGGGMGMQGGMGGYGGRGGYGSRRGGGMQGGMQGNPMMQGTQWVSETAIAAVMAGNQVGPTGKPNNPFVYYLKGMVVPLVLIPIMLVLLLSGVLTQVGFYLGDLIAGAISSKM